MINAVLIFNNYGKPRLLKFYQRYPEDVQHQIVREAYQLVSKRAENVCHFLETGSVTGGNDFRLIYRQYATLYLVFRVDAAESELGILDLIQVFVETLDKTFENVCELDLIFHCDKAHYILNEIIMGGVVMETSVTEVLSHIEAQNKLEKMEGGLAANATKALQNVKNLSPSLPTIQLPNLNITLSGRTNFTK